MNKMNPEDIRQHWEGWANKYKTDLRATTKSSTAKDLEIHTLISTVSEYMDGVSQFTALEVGCGNGYNCFALKSAFPESQVTGVDYISEMIAHANDINDTHRSGIEFLQGDVLELDKIPALATKYDLVFTVRCIINLHSDEQQMAGIEQLTKKVSNNGLLVLIENQQKTFNNQNVLRKSIGLNERKTADFNHFMNEEILVEKLECLNFSLLNTYNFSSLHDLIQYVLLPLTQEGEVTYEHPLVQAATKLTIASGTNLFDQFGEFGQNKLFVFKCNEK